MLIELKQQSSNSQTTALSYDQTPMFYVSPRIKRTQLPWLSPRETWGTVPSRMTMMLMLMLTSFSAVSTPAADLSDYSGHEEFLDTYCSRCHNDDRLSGNWSLSMVNPADVAKGIDLDAWEKILRMTSEQNMPPAKRPQPSDSELADFTGWLQSSLDGYSASHPNPGRATMRRLNRAEYGNAVRDLLAIDIELSDQLPADDSGYGFDNIADLLSVSSTLMDRYFSVAGKVSRLAVGLAPAHSVLTVYQVPKDGSILNQGLPSYNERMSASLPLDSRGGGEFKFYAPYDGTYEISGYLNANTNNEVDRLKENLKTKRLSLKAGMHSIGMSFRKQLALDETVQTLRNNTDIVPLPTQPPISMTLDFVVDNSRVGSTEVPSYYMSPRFAQVNFLRDIVQINVEGPLTVSGSGHTPSQRKVFLCRPTATINERACATQILSRFARQAYRRPVSTQDIDLLLGVYDSGREDADFETGIATAIQAILVSPGFLFLVEQDPLHSTPGSRHRISDVEFASRMSLFLWSSLPDEELLALAEANNLRQPATLRAQLKRMLLDPKAEALTQNFAGQWLYLRNLEFHRPDVMAYPDFDARLRAAMYRESAMFFSEIIRQDASVLEFIDADYSFMNERLALHYGLDNIQGVEFRRVVFEPEVGRGGLLGHASLLTVTSYGNHTSIVKRGQWILDHLLAAPPPPAPPDVPALLSEQGGKALNAREQMALHRQDPACASCHVKMDPLGLSLENYDAIGAFRVLDAGRPIDALATLPNGTSFEGLDGLQQVLLEQKDQFTRALTEQLLTYALGRGLEAYDRPIVRAIAEKTAADNYRMQRIFQEILDSEPFNFRRTVE
jgi:mono/diheme cytochrome c family protein